MFAPTTLFALLSSLTALPALAGHNQPRQPHHQLAAEYEARRLQELEERLLPITATTTIYVEETHTQTVWVQPTDQVHYEPSGSVTATATSSESEESSASVAESSSVISVTVSVEASSSPEASASETSQHSASPSTSTSDASLSSSGARSSSAPAVSGTATATEASSSEAPTSITSGTLSATITASASSSRSKSNAPTRSRSSGSGGPRPTPTSSLPSESSSAAETSLVIESASSSYPHETLWSTSASSIITAVTASASSSLSASASDSSSYWSSASASLSASASSYWSSDISASTSPSAAPSSTSSASASSSTLAPLGARLMNGYYPDWAAYYLAPEAVDWSKYDVMEFAFALPTQDGGLQFTQDDSSDLLHRLVASGHAAGKRVKLSIGGWTGSAYFSTLCADDGLRATFVQSIVKAYQAYNIDGIDIDWEYPGTSGAAGNAVSSSDSANYLRFLQDMRAALPSDALITTATQVWPFAGPDGSPLADVSAFAEVLDWILIMNYDIWGSSSSPGPNAPLSDACGNSTQPLANAYAAVSSWTTAGMPANKITLGVPAYGYLSGSWANSLVQRRSHFPQPPHKRAAAARLQARDDVTVNNGNGGTTDGQVMFYSLLQQGALASDGQGGYTGAGGFVRHWDSCSSTPWLKSDSSGQIITYDDTESMSLKGQFAAQAGIRGCNVFSVDGDFTNPGFPLTDAVRSGLGL